MRAVRKITCSRGARLTASIGTIIKTPSAKSTRAHLSASFLPISFSAISRCSSNLAKTFPLTSLHGYIQLKKTKIILRTSQMTQIPLEWKTWNKNKINSSLKLGVLILSSHYRCQLTVTLSCQNASQHSCSSILMFCWKFTY